jgi:deoxyadenosine/deoxycytidine kinase
MKIAIDGPIGVGKSSLMRALAKRLGLSKVHELPDNKVSKQMLTWLYDKEPNVEFVQQSYFVQALIDELDRAE